MASDHDQDAAVQRTRVEDTTRTVRIVLAVLLAVVVAVLAIANTDDTNVDYLLGDTDAPLFVVVLAAAVAGALIAALLRARRRHQH